MDETPVQIPKKPGKKANSKSWRWVQRGGTAQGPAILFEYDPARSEEVPKRVLGVLDVVLPKMEEAKPRSIQVQVL
ncbi:MAG: transposase [Magnetococcales bacterium]|nr:transposase [Magnetococcales bacterium]